MVARFALSHKIVFCDTPAYSTTTANYEVYSSIFLGTQ